MKGLLIQKGDVESVTRARRLLQIAQQFSDRRFTWWRVVLEELESSSENTKSISRVNAKRRPKSIAKTVRSFQKVRQSFRSIEALLNHQERGYQLERLVYAVAELTLDMAAPPYRFRRFHSSYAQVDGYFEHRGAKYRVECKWEDQQTEPTAIEKLAGKIDVAGVSGCFISMSGFMKSAIECARGLLSSKPLILIDGEEIRAVVNKQINFDELLTRKRLHLDKYSDPYHKLNLSAADSA